MCKLKKDQLPADAIDALARCLLSAIRDYFENKQGRREFAEWQAQAGIFLSVSERKAA